MYEKSVDVLNGVEHTMKKMSKKNYLCEFFHLQKLNSALCNATVSISSTNVSVGFI